MTDVTDDFNRANGGIGANWTTKTDAATTIVSNQVRASATTDHNYAAAWTANTFPSNHYAQIKLITVGNFGTGGGPSVRNQTGADTFYTFFVNDDSITGPGAGYMLEFTANVITQIGATYDLNAPTANDVIKLDVTGTTLTPSINGGALSTQTDASITGGTPGFLIYNNPSTSPQPTYDDWLGGPITAATTDGVGGGTGAGTAVATSAALAMLVPDADITDGGWLTDTGGTSLFAAIDETPASDTDYIVSSDTDTDTCEIRLSDPSFTLARPFSVAYRYKRIGTDTPTLRVQLMEGATSRASWDVAVSSSTFTAGEQFLTAPEFASIIDFTDLRVRFTAIRESALGLEGDFSGDLTLEGDFSGSLLVEGT